MLLHSYYSLNVSFEYAIRLIACESGQVLGLYELLLLIQAGITYDAISPDKSIGLTLHPIIDARCRILSYEIMSRAAQKIAYSKKSYSAFIHLNHRKVTYQVQEISLYLNLNNLTK